MIKEKLTDKIILNKKEIPEPTGRQLSFKIRKCSRCGRDFHPVVGTQPTCGHCYYSVICDFCGEWFDPKAIKITKLEQLTQSNNYCCKKHGDKDKIKKINNKKVKQSLLKLYVHKDLSITKKIIINNYVSLIIEDNSIASIKGAFVIKTCERCNREFYPSAPNQTTCGCCHYEIKCNLCGKISINKSYIKLFKKDVEFYCKHCSASNTMNKLWKDDEYREKTLSHLEKGITIKYCNTCKKETQHIGSRCRICQPWETSGKGMKLKYCEKCNKQTYHIGNRCSICEPWEISIPCNINKDWLNLSIKDKINQSIKWLKDNPDDSAKIYIKNNLELLKMKYKGIYNEVFKDIFEDIGKSSKTDGWIYAHIYNKEIYYIGQTMRDPIIRYAEHRQLREKGLLGNDQRFKSIEDYIITTGINEEVFNKSKVVCLHRIPRNNMTEDQHKKLLDIIEEDCIKLHCPKLNFYMIELNI